MSPLAKHRMSRMAMPWLIGCPVTLLVVLVQAVWAIGGQEEGSSDRSSRASRPNTEHSSQRTRDLTIEEQLDQILADQQVILTRADELLDDLRVAKIRVSR